MTEWEKLLDEAAKHHSTGNVELAEKLRKIAQELRKKGK